MAGESTSAVTHVDDGEVGKDEDLSISIEMDKRVDLLLSFVVAGVGVYICYLASSFRVGTFPDPVTTRGLPYFTGGFLVFAGLANAARRLLTWSLIPGNYTVSEGSDDEPGHPASALRTFAILGLAFVWVALFRSVGYLLITPPIMFAMLLLMRVRDPLKLIGFPVGFTLTIWLVFSQVLSIILPLGPLTHLARAWGLTP